MNKREEIIASIIGFVTGSIIGAIMSYAYWNESRITQSLREENEILKEILWEKESLIEQNIRYETKKME